MPVMEGMARMMLDSLERVAMLVGFLISDSPRAQVSLSDCLFGLWHARVEPSMASQFSHMSI